MRVAVFESIVMPAGHEVEFDRLLIDELKRQNYDPCFFVPEKFPFKFDYGVAVEYLSGGEVVSYAGVGPLKKLFLSAVREKRRVAWFNSAYAKAKEGLCDAIIIPTATYRYLRTLRHSKLKDSQVPVYFIFHGINPQEQANFEKEARKCSNHKNIHLKVITLRDDFKNSGLTNLDLINPPVFKPQDMPVDKELHFHKPLQLGFFGQFRKEKNLGFFLEAFTKANFLEPVELLVQGATAKPEDGEAFENFAKDYEDNKNIKFLHKNLIGLEWQKALLGVDVIMAPYAAERYRYHWSAMLFTAIGFFKPIVVSAEINPEVLEQYKVGTAIKTSSVDDFASKLSSFVNDLIVNKKAYEEGLLAANEAYSHAALVHNILK